MAGNQLPVVGVGKGDVTEVGDVRVPTERGWLL